jgi:nucleotide-binding universal stress UspA family protein
MVEPEFPEDVEAKATIDDSTNHYQEVLKPLQERVAAAGIRGRCEVAVGHPAEQIVLYADKYGTDHIVVGRRGHTLFERWVIGAVARQVIAHAPCAVSVVRR